MPEDSIKIVVRVRPFNEIERGSECIVEMDGSECTLKGAGGDKKFNFHRCYWSHDDIAHKKVMNTDLFEDIGKEILSNAYEGYNSTIFAYGQTGSGKSYSIEGYAPEKGLLQLICE
jgi:kinesin family protein 1